MIELLNSGDTEEPAVLNVEFEPSWDKLFKGVENMVANDVSGGDAEEAQSDHHFDGDCTQMQED